MFEFKPFEDMTAEDYRRVGLRVGLEIHQQLLTEKKIFCRCPAGLYDDRYDSEILRHMRPTLSELGEYDGTALMEFKTRKNIIYRINRESVCTYEMDDTPPFMINEQALDIALEVAIMLNLNLVDELHIARKQYLDGSIPTGFQRTTIVGVDGWIPFKDKKIGIYQLGLEEDACREVSDIGHERVYLTDRLGMPLIEPVTHPDMHTPQEAAEVGQLLRAILRSTGKVRTGHGATRQDVNVSVEGGTRNEIKGVPSIRRIPRLVYNEAMRQWNLLRLRDTLAGRGVTPDSFRSGITDATEALAGTGFDPVRTAVAEGAVVRAVRLDGFAGLLSEKTQTGAVFADELSDRVRVIACLNRLPNIVYTGEPQVTLTDRQWREVGSICGAGENDAVVVTWGAAEDAECGAREIEIRAREATQGVPNETRQAKHNDTTGFERILPGPDRMYPDTDLPPIALSKDRVARIRSGVPEPVWDRRARLEAMGLATDVVNRLQTSRWLGVFETATGELGVDAGLAADLLGRKLRWLSRCGVDTSKLTDGMMLSVFRALSGGDVTREGVLPVLRLLIAEPPAGGSETDDKTLSGVIAALGIRPVDDGELDERISEVVDGFDFGELRKPELAHRYLMGLLMENLAGSADGARVSRRLARALEHRGGGDGR
jgi:glutamyl-tRNA(Gln) amidotransferase subunit E